MNCFRNQITELMNSDSSRLVADMAVELIGNNPAAFSVIYNLTVNSSYPVNMRAARAMYLCVEKYPQLMSPYLEEFTTHIVNQKVEGVKRGLLKIASESLDLSKLPDLGLLVDHCFNLIVDTSQPYAFRVYAMDAVYRACLEEPLLKNELKAVLELLPDDSPISVRSRAKNVLKKLSGKKR